MKKASQELRTKTYFRIKETIKSPHEEIKIKNSIDLNDLYFAFQNWLDIFPDLVYFQKLKNNYKNKIPLNIFLYNLILFDQCWYFRLVIAQIF